MPRSRDCKDKPWTVERFGFAVDPFVASQVVLSDKGSTAEANEQKQIVSWSSQESHRTGVTHQPSTGQTNGLSLRCIWMWWMIALLLGNARSHPSTRHLNLSSSLPLPLPPVAVS